MKRFPVSVFLGISVIMVVFSTLSFAQGLVEANELFLAGKYAEAKAIVQPIVDSDPGYAAAVYLLGKIYYKMGDLNKARELIDKAISLDLGNQEFRDTRNEMATFASKLTEASRLFNNADYEGAKKVYEEIIQENPNFVKAYIDLGRVCVRLNDLMGAAEAFGKAIEKDPNNEDYKKEFTSVEDQKLLDKALKAETQEEKEKIKDKLAKEMRKYYIERLLVFPNSEHLLNHLIWGLIGYANEIGEPILMGDNRTEWTTQRLQEIQHKHHLLRRSLAQNMVNQGVPMEVIAEYAVGWKDITTLRDYYGTIEEARKNKAFIDVVNRIL